MLEAIKLAALDVLDKGSLADFCYGIVMSTEPLKIMLEQKLELTEPFLICTRNVSDYEMHGRISINGYENQEYTAMVENHLHTGDKVILMKASGGQQYVVIDRLAELKGD